ncbi:hypothetical protein ABIB25_002836 [Nakamurella sp. UYEF19]|uniref:hypothetical protein n=1 Tax=Nakamurella sp. UYEF19 TaxID=1756392 RepID=UPI0033947CD8
MSMPGTAQPTIGSNTRLPGNSWWSRLPVPALVVWMLGAAFFFRQPLFTGFDSITGDSGDARLIIYLHEHWVQVLQANASWRDPAFFFPARGVFGYSDTFVLNEVFYAPLRLIGLDQFVAYEWTLVLLTLVGCLGA